MTTTPTAAAVCECARCRAHRAGLGPGPFTPSEYQKIAPPLVVSPTEDGVGADPEVIAAEQARDEARVAFDACDSIWLAAVAAHQSAVLLGADPYLRDAAGDIIGRRTGPRAAAVAGSPSWPRRSLRLESAAIGRGRRS